MVKDGHVTGDYRGERTYHDPVHFQQAVTGMMNVAGTGQIWYVDKNKATGTTGDGTTWKKAFLTITEGFAALDDYDVLLIAPGNYDEADTITLTGKKGCKILGFANGMNWGEGSTTWRDVESDADLLYLTGCQSIEIAGISFINSQAYDGINFTGLNYSVHIHHCCFTGQVGGGATGLNAIDGATSNGPDLYVHDCRFVNYATTAIIMGSQRNTIVNNVFIVPDNGIGINAVGPTSMTYGEFVIADNHFLGGGTGDHGIYYTAWTANQGLVSNNKFAGFAKSVPDNVDNTETGFVWNYESDSTAGGVAAVAPNPS